MINFRFIANLMGRLLLIESAFLLLCVLIALIYGEHDASAFFLYLPDHHECRFPVV